MSVCWGGAEGVGEGQEDSTLSMEPDVGLDPMTSASLPRRSQESDTRPTEPPRCPLTSLVNGGRADTARHTKVGTAWAQMSNLG